MTGQLYPQESKVSTAWRMEGSGRGRESTAGFPFPGMILTASVLFSLLFQEVTGKSQFVFLVFCYLTLDQLSLEERRMRLDTMWRSNGKREEWVAAG